MDQGPRSSLDLRNKLMICDKNSQVKSWKYKFLLKNVSSTHVQHENIQKKFGDQILCYHPSLNNNSILKVDILYSFFLLLFRSCFQIPSFLWRSNLFSQFSIFLIPCAHSIKNYITYARNGFSLTCTFQYKDRIFNHVQNLFSLSLLMTTPFSRIFSRDLIW